MPSFLFLAWLFCLGLSVLGWVQVMVLFWILWENAFSFFSCSMRLYVSLLYLPLSCVYIYILSIPNLFSVECLILSKAFLMDWGDQIVFVLYFGGLFCLLIYICLLWIMIMIILMFANILLRVFMSVFIRVISVYIRVINLLELRCSGVAGVTTG